MGELEEKVGTPGEGAAPQQEAAEEPKETDKMLEKKDNADAAGKEKLSSPSIEKKSPTGSKKIALGGSASSKPTTPTGGEKKKDGDGSDLVVKVNGGGGEEIIHIPIEGGTAGSDGKGQEDEKKISKEEREVKPKKIPIGGLKLPGFFMKSKPKVDGDGAEGELLEKEQKDEQAIEAAAAAKVKKDDKPRPTFGQRLRNFFVRNPNVEKQTKQSANGDADTKSEATAEATPGATNGPEGNNGSANRVTATNEAPPQKRGLLNAIKLPIANMIPKKKSEEDVEMGMGKAGLASMETLDDSLKDQDCVDKAPPKNNGTDDVGKLKKSSSGDIKEADEKTPEEDRPPATLLERIRGYKCSLDDTLIAFGILVFLLLIAVIGFVLSHETLTSPPIRNGRFIDAVTSCGMVEGLKEDRTFAFRGIPYALAPVEKQRWRPAQLIERIDGCWNDTLKAHNSSAPCIQRLGNGSWIGEEDCLFLDVMTPHVRYKSPLPVVVMIGAETLTGASSEIFTPDAYAAETNNVIFVRPNFRLGVFGFLALEALTKDAYPHTSGNYALSDIIAALKWIKLNIVHFGGDPKSVTLWGHRAGATLVSALVTSNKVADLYTRAWVSSSSAIFPGKPLKFYEKRNEMIMSAVGCSEVSCLRKASPESLRAAIPDFWFDSPVDIPRNDENTNEHHEWLILDENILQQHPADVWKKEHGGNMKMVIGTTAHESHTEHLRMRHANWTADEVRAFIAASKIGTLNLTDETIRRYNATNYRGLVAMITDIRAICPLLTNARLQTSVAFYVVTQGHGEDELANMNADVQAILGRYKVESLEQRSYVSAMQSLFYTFVTTGEMPQFDSRRRVLNIGEKIVALEDHINCNFWISNDIVPRYARAD